jgi:hypothetical protein
MDLGKLNLDKIRNGILVMAYNQFSLYFDGQHKKGQNCFKNNHLAMSTLNP